MLFFLDLFSDIFYTVYISILVALVCDPCKGWWGWGCGQRVFERETKKECREVIILLSVVQESGLKGEKHSILAESRILKGNIKFRRQMLGNLASGVCILQAFEKQIRVLSCNSASH